MTPDELVDAALQRDEADKCNLCPATATLFQSTPEGFIGWCSTCAAGE